MSDLFALSILISFEQAMHDVLSLRNRHNSQLWGEIYSAIINGYNSR